MPQTSEVQFTIRDYHSADFDRLWEIDQLCFPPGIAYTQMELSGYITRRNAITLVAEAAGSLPPEAKAHHDGLVRDRSAGEASPKPIREQIVGFVVAHPAQKQIGRILTIDVAPHARRSGLGEHLMHESEQRLRARGCKKVYLETAVNNKAAMQLYRKLGYEVLYTLPNYYSSHALAAYLLAKEL